MPQISEELLLTWDQPTDHTGPDGVVIPVDRGMIDYYEVRRGANWTFGKRVICTPCTSARILDWCVGTETYWVRGRLKSGWYTQAASVSVTAIAPADHSAAASSDEHLGGWAGGHDDTMLDADDNLTLVANATTGTYTSVEIDMGAIARWRIGIMVHVEGQNRSTKLTRVTWDDVAAKTYDEMMIEYGGLDYRSWTGRLVNEIDTDGNNYYRPTAGWTLTASVYNVTGVPGAFTTFTPGEYYGRYIQFKLTLTRTHATDLAVDNATNATPIVVTTNPAHGLETNDGVTIHGVNGNTAANGTWQITYVSPTEFSLNDSIGNGAYTNGGTVVPGEYIYVTKCLTSYSKPPVGAGLIPGEHTHDSADEGGYLNATDIFNAGAVPLARGGSAADLSGVVALHLLRMNAATNALEDSTKTIADFADAVHNHDHGALLGIGDDDHAIYALVSGGRAFTGDVTMNTGLVVNEGGGDNNIRFESENSAQMFVVDAGTDRVGIHTLSPAYVFSVGSTDGSDQIGLYHDNSDAYFKWTDGDLRLITDEGTNSRTIVSIFGKGTEWGELRVYDQDDAEFLIITSQGGSGFICVEGTAPGALHLQDTADAGVELFVGSTEGITLPLTLYGFRTGDEKRALEISISPDVDDAALFGNVDKYVFDGDVAIGDIDPAYKFSIGSAGDTDQIGIYHDNSDAYITWTDGELNLITDEGTDENTDVRIKGKGTGYGILRIYDEDDAEHLDLYCQAGVGIIQTAGTSPGILSLLPAANAAVSVFADAAEGETEELKIYGYRTGDSKRSLEIGVGVDAADTVSFDGIGNAYFDMDIGILATPTAGYALDVNGTVKLRDDIDVQATAIMNCGSAGGLILPGTLPASDGAIKIEDDGFGGPSITVYWNGGEVTIYPPP